MILNLEALEVGAVVRLKDGALVRATENPGDGMWVTGTYLESEKEPALVGTEDLVFGEMIAEQVTN
ncbi:hypothetical protein [Sphingobium phenoxybenzoativorans]|uniref:hypothetical protein n=1 Tax=Sphingobium phenoxybenzoativorans TaxID=1592790 RepID=UPI0008728F2A|nr:hypothetical protein [Sphingobium phenoxybenzoativorans]